MLIGLIGCAGSCTSGSKDPTNPASTPDAPQNSSAEPIEISEDEVISTEPGREGTDLPTVPPKTSEPTATEAPQTEQPQETDAPEKTTAPGTAPTAKASATPKPATTQTPTAGTNPTATPQTTQAPTPKPTEDHSGDIELPELP